MHARWTLIALGVLVAPRVSAQQGPTRFEEVRRFAAAEATQGVAVDDRYVYAIANRTIGKYEKVTGRRVGGWEGPANGPVIHLDSGVVIDGLLYCAHSNYPAVPMASSIEIFDPETMTHVGSHSFGIMEGSATWVDRWNGHWWVAFANYSGPGGVPGRGSDWTSLVEFDESWRRVAGFVYPPSVVERFDVMSNSGGTWGADGRLYITGHDEAAVFMMALPTSGSMLTLERELPIAAEGQGIAWDRAEPGVMYSIIRSSREVVESRLR
jgi:hypothetical protein